MKKDNNLNIKCNVTSCCHNNQKDDCTCSKETICESFKSRENE